MKKQESEYSPYTIKQISGMFASNDLDSENYLKGPELVELFQELGFYDAYSYENGIGIQTTDIGENLSRLKYTTKRLEILNHNFRVQDAIRAFAKRVKNPAPALDEIEHILNKERQAPNSCNSSSSKHTSLTSAAPVNLKNEEPVLTFKKATIEEGKMEKKNSPENNDDHSILGDVPSNCPIVFISYSWDSQEHKDWVRKLADDLTSNGIYVLFDEYTEAGTMLPLFMSQGIERANKVIVIGTKQYKRKAENANSGVGFEDCAIQISLLGNLNSKKIIPCLREGKFEESFPILLTGCKGHDFRKDENYTEELNDLCREIWGHPKNQRPQLGNRPAYVKE